MDLLFDGLDQLMERVRRRFPVALTVLGLLAWSAVAGVGSYLFGTESLVFGAALSAGPLVLVALATVRGIGRLPWPVWPVGVSTLVFVGGLFAPQAAEWASDGGYGWVISVVVFVYVQVFLGTLQAVVQGGNQVVLAVAAAAAAGTTARPSGPSRISRVSRPSRVPVAPLARADDDAATSVAGHEPVAQRVGALSALVPCPRQVGRPRVTRQGRPHPAAVQPGSLASWVAQNACPTGSAYTR